MYIPSHFEITDENEIFSFIELNAFGQLISSVKGKSFSTHIPFLVSQDKKSLVGHLAKQNPQHLELDSQEVLVTFQGPHHYISPSWYRSSGVPTWNYQAAHVYGVCKVFTDREKIKLLIDTLTEKYESAFEEPWQPTYKASMLSAIVGFEIEIEELQCKYKLSQNRGLEDRERVIKMLEESDSSRLSEAMQRNES